MTIFQKISLYQEMYNILKRNRTIKGFCAAFCYAYVRLYSFEDYKSLCVSNNVEEIMLDILPELIAYKPRKKSRGSYWFFPWRRGKRLRILKRIINKLKMK